jgi:hypothetical protein
MIGALTIAVARAATPHDGGAGHRRGPRAGPGPSGVRPASSSPESTPSGAASLSKGCRPGEATVPASKVW